jgi:hypothetical protein
LPAATATWEFTLTHDAVTPDEQQLFASDLARLGLDEIAWLVLNGTLSVATVGSVPKALRGYCNGKLVGVAYIIEGRHYGQSLFAHTVWAKLLDWLALPICIWLRFGVLTDGAANPGFVAQGIARPEFVARALTFLRQRYLLGGVVEGVGELSAGSFAAFPFCDYGMIDLHNIAHAEELFPDSKNLKRKLNKFRNKGGEIRIIEGALSPVLRDAAISCLNSIQAVLVSPFQDNYNNMVLCAAAHSTPRILHFVATLEEECVGYHTFAHCGNSLYCLSGAFDRTRHTNYHAYENLIMATIHHALEHGLHNIHYGMVVNETKAKMMSRFAPIQQRYFARFALFNSLVHRVISRSQLASPTIAAYANLANPSLDGT